MVLWVQWECFLLLREMSALSLFSSIRLSVRPFVHPFNIKWNYSVSSLAWWRILKKNPFWVVPLHRFETTVFCWVLLKAVSLNTDHARIVCLWKTQLNCSAGCTQVNYTYKWKPNKQLESIEGIFPYSVAYSIFACRATINRDATLHLQDIWGQYCNHMK